jgi:hypothetical protein
MTLEKLVPPLELCKLIPAGEFEKSVFIWMEVEASATMEKTWSLMQGTPYARQRPNRKIPAPTLQEIMEVLPHDDAYNDLLIGYSGKVDKLTGWHIYYNGDRNRHCYDQSAATAALRLWLKLKGVDV